VIHQGGYLGVGIDPHKPAAELIAVADADQPGVVFGAGMAQGQKLLEHDRDLHAVGRGQGVELERMAPDGQWLVMSGA
jgi:hypothetical protein